MSSLNCKLGRLHICLIAALKHSRHRCHAAAIAELVAEELTGMPETTSGALHPRGVVGVVRCVMYSLCDNENPYKFLCALKECNSAHFAHGYETVLFFLNEMNT